VTWTGELPTHAVAEHLGAADLFVWPGTGEAYGIAYLEAQAAGLPVVAQATGGVPAVVRHGVTGLLTPAGDDAAYAAAIVRLIGDADLRRRLGQAARSFVTRGAITEAAAARLRGLLEPLLVTCRGLTAHEGNLIAELGRWIAAQAPAVITLWLRDDDAVP
jgi:glycosyltransferase involved in cell wall biosynthesis